MTAQRVQGVVFGVSAILLALAPISLPSLDERTQLIVLAGLIVILGVPHGALDTVFAREIYQVRSLADWLRFTVIYLVPVALVVLLWQAAPTLFLLGFLGISIAHFSGDPADGTHALSRMLYGGAIVVLPALFHSRQVAELFAFLTGPDAAVLLTDALHILGWPWLIGLAVAALFQLKRDPFTSVEFAAVALLSTVSSPLVAFTIFFCGMHSARHILRTIDYSRHSSPQLLLAASSIPMLAVLLAGGFAMFWLQDLSLETRIIQLVFVGLAALTVPHMALVERVRFAGWVKRTTAHP